MYKKTVLKNNIIVVSHHMPRAYSVSVGVWLKVGSRYEDDRIAGISHFLEHVVFKGSQKYDNETIKRQIEGNGGLLNAFTSEELTCYLAKVPQKRAFSTFSILLDMALNPLLKQEDIKKERTVIIEEIRMYNDLPPHIVQDLLDKTMWPNHPLGRNIAGSIDSVSSISKEDLSNFQNKYYRPQNMVIVFVGDIKHKDCIAFVNKALGNKKTERQDYHFDKFYSRQVSAQAQMLAKDIEQTKLAIGFPAYSRTHSKRFVLGLIYIILGGNMSSRLFDEVREKRGLAYEISSQYKQLIDTGAFYIHAGIDNKKISLALDLIFKELSKLKKNLVSQSELSRAKEYCLSQLAMGLEDTMEHMVFLGVSASTTNELLDFNTIKKAVNKIKPKELLEVSNEIFNKEKVNVSLVGPVQEFKKDYCLDSIKSNLC
jgi:predicted Zn-dependent peptidase